MDILTYAPIIAPIMSLIGVIITVAVGNKLTLYRIDQLEQKVKAHSDAVNRLTIVETQIKELQHEMVRIHNKGAFL